MKTTSLLSVSLAVLVVLFPGLLWSQTTVLSGTIDTGSADQIYTNPVIDNGNSNNQLNLITTGQVTFQSTVDGDANGSEESLTINTTQTTAGGTPATDVTTVGSTTLGAVGQTSPLASVSINGNLATTPGTIVPGATTTLNGNVTTVFNDETGAGGDSSGVQIYGNAVVLGHDVTLLSTPSGSSATFFGVDALGDVGNITLNSSVDGAHALAISTPGVVTLGAVGQTTALTSLTTTNVSKGVDQNPTEIVENGFGTTVLNGNVTTTGAQTYGTTVILGNNVTLNSTGGAAISLGQILPASLSGGGTATYALTIDGGGAVTFNGNVSVTSLNVGSGPVTVASFPYSYEGVTIATSSANAQVYSALILQTDTTLVSTGGGDITINSALNSPYALAISTTGMTTLQSVGQTTALGSLSVTGAVTLNGNVTTTSLIDNNLNAPGGMTGGAQNYGGPITLGTDITLTSTGNVPDSGGSVTLGSVIGGSHSLTITDNAAVTFTGGTVAVTALNLGSSSVDVTGATTIDTPTALTLNNVSGTGNALTVSDAGGLTLAGNVELGSLTDLGGPVTLSASGVAYQITTVDLTGPVTLGANVTVVGESATLGSVNGAGHDLTIADSGASVLGTVTNVGALTVSAGTLALNGNITTTGAQNLGGAVTLGIDITLDDTGPTGTITLDDVTGGGHSLTIEGGQGLTLNNLSGVTTLTETTSAVTLNAGSISAGTINFGNESVTLEGSTTLTTTSGLTMGTVLGNENNLTIVGNASLGSVSGVNLLTDTSGTLTFTGNSYSTSLGMNLSSVILGATGTTTINDAGTEVVLGSVTGASGFHNLTISGGGIVTLGSMAGVATLTDTSGTLTLSGGTVSATSVNLLGAAITLGGDTTVTATGVATLGNVTGGSHALTINGGATTTLQTVSGVTDLTVSNAVTLDGNVSTTDAQAYNGAVTLGADMLLSSTGGAIALNSTVDGAHTLTIDTTGATTLGAVGQTTALTSLTTDAGGTTTLDGNVTTTGAQTYGDAVILGADVTLASTGNSAISLGTVDGAHALTVNTTGGTALGAVGQAMALTSLTTNAGGTTTLNGSVTTTGAQTYGDAVTLGNDLTLASTGNGAIALNSTVDGAHALTVATGGAVTLGTVGGTTALSSLTVLGGSLALANNITVTGPLSLTTTGSAITQSSGVLTVGGTAFFNAGTDSITLNSAGNSFTGAVSLFGSNAAITNSTALTLGDSTLSETLALSAASGITITGIVSASTTTVNSGSLQIGNGGTTGAILGNLASNGAVTFDESGAVSYGGAYSGSGSLTQAGTGTLVLTGANSYTGGTTISAGTLQGDATSLQGNITDNAALIFNQAADGTYAGVISSTGTMTKTGAGDLILTGNNTYTGTTAIQQGTLEVDGSIASPVIVNSGAALMGNGTIFGNVTSNGILSPGTASTIGTLTIQGDLTLSNSSIVNMRVNGSGNSDLIAVSGTAHLAGTLQLTPGNGVLGGQSFTLINANAINGTFSTVNVLGNAVTFVSTYSSHSLSVTDNTPTIQITTVQNSFSTFAATPNQSTVAAALNSIAADPREATLISALNSLPGSALPAALAEISPLQQTTMSQTSLSSSRASFGTLQDRMGNIRAGSTGLSLNQFNLVNPDIPAASLIAGTDMPTDIKAFMPSPTNPWGFFAAADGNFGDIDGKTSQSNYYGTGFTLGSDYRLNQAFTVGFATGYDYSKTDFNNSGSNSTANSIRFGPYATWKDKTGDWVDGTVGGAYHWYDSNREGFGGTATSNTTGLEFDSSVKYGHDFKVGPWTLTPTFGFDYLHLDIDPYTETGSLAPLSIQDQTADSFRSNLGGQVAYGFKWKGVGWSPYVAAGWAHEFLDADEAVSARFASGAGDVFTTTGDNLGHDSATFGAGLSAGLTDSVTAKLSYSGEANGEYQDHSFDVSVRVQF